MNPEIEAHLRSLVNFPRPPGVATHIIELARDPDIEMGKVAKVLSLDSALSSKVLRIANSPLYAQRRKSENLRQALVVLGLNATLTLALSFSLVKTLRTGKVERHRLPALLAPRAGRRNRRAGARRCPAPAHGGGNIPRRAAAGCRHPRARSGVARSVSRRGLGPARPSESDRDREAPTECRSCRDRRVAHGELELAAAPVSRHRVTATAWISR